MKRSPRTPELTSKSQKALALGLAAGTLVTLAACTPNKNAAPTSGASQPEVTRSTSLLNANIDSLTLQSADVAGAIFDKAMAAKAIQQNANDTKSFSDEAWVKRNALTTHVATFTVRYAQGDISFKASKPKGAGIDPAHATDIDISWVVADQHKAALDNDASLTPALFKHLLETPGDLTPDFVLVKTDGNGVQVDNIDGTGSDKSYIYTDPHNPDPANREVTLTENTAVLLGRFNTKTLPDVQSDMVASFEMK